MSLKVGRDLFPGKECKTSYKNIYYDRDGWVDAKKYLPSDYDLVMIMFSTGEVTYGWTMGKNWQGVLVTHETVVKSWKKKLPEVG